jgi:hypothetical protein
MPRDLDALVQGDFALELLQNRGRARRQLPFGKRYTPRRIANHAEGVRSLGERDQLFLDDADYSSTSKVEESSPTGWFEAFVNLAHSFRQQ